MTQAVPEESNEAYDLTDEPPGEHESELSGEHDGDQAAGSEQQENAESSQDQPSQ